jgi:hypothetical protein
MFLCVLHIKLEEFIQFFWNKLKKTMFFFSIILNLIFRRRKMQKERIIPVFNSMQPDRVFNFLGGPFTS